jgi:hypothetical protein
LTGASFTFCSGLPSDAHCDTNPLVSELEPQLHPAAAFSETAERRLVWLLCALAAAHVFVFSSAFPFFNNVDERQHFDTVLKYAQGRFPHNLEMQSDETARYLDDYDSWEFLWTAQAFPGGHYPTPAWRQMTGKISAPRDSEPAQTGNANPHSSQEEWLQMVKTTKSWTNYESSQPPLYYSLAGLWWHLGEWCGATGLHLLYWLRFLNIVFVVALVWLGYRTAMLVFPENQFVRVGVPTLVAFMPQTAFYSITNDVLSPLCFGAAFLCLIRLWRAEIPGMKLGSATGLALATAFLTKISNLPLLAVSAAWMLLKCWRLSKSGKLRASSPALAALALAAGLPTVSWLVWCKLVYGDFTGSAAKIQILGWTHKPFADWWHHPIFSPQGLWLFVSENLASFWRGELVWHLKRLALPAVDAVYVITSICLLCVAMFAASPRFKLATTTQRQALLLGLGSFLATFAFLGFLSIIYDFHDCPYPSRGHPYFTSGRLMLGALIPFLLLFIFGLDCTMKRLSVPAKFSILTAIILFMLASEVAADWPVFSCPYNWFHL